MTLEGNPWFVGADILHVLYGASQGKGHVYDPLGKDERCKMKRIHLGLPGGRDMAIISESSLYKLIMRSDKPQAKAFQDWVTKEVLPSIRKTGSYSVLNEPQQLPLLDKPKGSSLGSLEAIAETITAAGASTRSLALPSGLPYRAGRLPNRTPHRPLTGR